MEIDKIRVNGANQSLLVPEEYCVEIQEQIVAEWLVYE